MSLVRFSPLMLPFALGACGVAPVATPVAQQSAAQVLEARSTKGLLEGFDRVHKAIFDKIDSNHDGAIDEYEAGTFLSLKAFQKADLNLTEKIEYREFVMFATDNGWMGWVPGVGKSDTKEKFASRFRNYLGERFHELDVNRDGFLKNTELSNRDLQYRMVGLDYSNLGVKVRITAVSDAEFKAGDKTADAKLSPAEFEDMFLDLVVAALAPKPPAPVAGSSIKK